MGRDAVLLSFRLGGTDGVSVEAGKWERALRSLGFQVRRVAGEIGDDRREDDVELPWLAITATSHVPDGETLVRTLRGADLVVVENVCSLPLNLPAARAARAVLAEHPGRVLFHHHDLPWQRPGLIDAEGFPPDLPGSLHVTINELSRGELAARGIDAITVHNRFDFDAPLGDRAATRGHFGFTDDDLVLLQPTRAIPRKNVGTGLAFAESLAALIPERSVRYWLTGAVEDGYGPELERLVSATSTIVSRGRADRTVDAYAAADTVMFPSTWEGFGNPVIESVVARRPLVVQGYPVLDEIAACGLQFFAIDEPSVLVDWLRTPDPAMLARNFELARPHYDLVDLPARVGEAFEAHGWTEW